MTRPKLDPWACCAECGGNSILHLHHVFGGTKAKRKAGEKYGCLEYLCWQHHEGNGGVHNDRELDLKYKEKHQIRLEEEGMSREEFREIFGKSYL